MEVCTDISIRLLGGFSVTVAGQEIPPGFWRLRKSRSLIKLLALAPGHRMHRDKVMDQLWPDMGLKEAVNNLHQTLYAARHGFQKNGHLCANFLHMQDEVLVLCGRGVPFIDVEAFETAAARATVSQALEDYQTASRLYSGDLLPEDSYETWTETRRETLQQMYFQLLIDEANLQEKQGSYTEANRLYQKVLAADAGQEAAHAGLMQLYALTGQKSLALQQYQQLKNYLECQLETVPDPQTTRLYEAILAGVVPNRELERKANGRAAVPSTALPERTQKTSQSLHNLPQRWTSFIGREKDMKAVVQLAQHGRLVTITGASGVGKTSLAIQAAGQILDAFAHGVWLVELANLPDGKNLVQACSAVLNADRATSLADLKESLAGKQILLVLDNCEHLLTDTVRLVSELLHDAPGLHVLATSRERMKAPGEAVYHLNPLPVPEPGQLPPPQHLAQVESVRLFVERARLVQPGYTLAEADAPAVASICQHLDGIPLAIELAAARMRLLSARQISARLDNRFRLLTGGSQLDAARHRTLQAMVAWSYELLSEKERLLFQRLASFAGGWNLEAAEAVGAGDGLTAEDIVDLLEQLVDKSLVVLEPPKEAVLLLEAIPPDTQLPPDGPRFRFLETIRLFALEHLKQSGCEYAVRGRHLAYFAALTAQAEVHFRGWGSLQWLQAMDSELENLRAALEWAQYGSIEVQQAERLDLGFQMAADLFWYWHIRSMTLESIEWYEKLFAVHLPGDTTAGRTLQRARALRAFSAMCVYAVMFGLRSYTEQEQAALLEESIAILRELGPAVRGELGISLFFYLFLVMEDETALRANPLFDEMRAHLHAAQCDFYLSEMFFYLRVSQLGPQEGFANLQESLEICRRTGDSDGISSRLHYLGMYYLGQGQYEKSVACVQEAIAIARRLGNAWLIGEGYATLAEVALAQGRYEEAASFASQVFIPPGSRHSRYLSGVGLSRQIRVAWCQRNSAWGQQLYAQLVKLGNSTSAMHHKSSRLYLALIHLDEGRSDEAESVFKEVLQDPAMTNLVLVGLLGLAQLGLRQGQLHRSALLFGAAMASQPLVKCKLPYRVEEECQIVERRLKSALDAAEFAELVAQGQRMNEDEIAAVVR